MLEDRYCRGCKALKSLDQYVKWGHGKGARWSERCAECHEKWKAKKAEDKRMVLATYDPEMVPVKIAAVLSRAGLTREQVLEIRREREGAG